MTFRWRMILASVAFVTAATLFISETLTRRAAETLTEQVWLNLAIQTDVIRNVLMSALDDASRAMDDLSASRFVYELLNDVDARGMDEALAAGGLRALLPAYDYLNDSPLMASGLVEVIALYSARTGDPLLSAPHGPRPDPELAANLCPRPDEAFPGLRRIDNTLTLCRKVHYPFTHRIIGYIGVRFSHDRLRRMLEAHRPDRDTTVFILGALKRDAPDWRFFISAGDEPDERHSELVDKLLATPDAELQQFGPAIAVSHQGLLGCFIPLLDKRFFVGATLPEEKILAPLTELRMWTWGALIIANIAAMCLALLITNRLSGSAQSLVQDLGRIGAGELDIKVQPGGRSRDMRALAEAVTDMAANLDLLQRELVQIEKLAATAAFASGLADRIKGPVARLKADLESRSREVDSGAGVDRPGLDELEDLVSRFEAFSGLEDLALTPAPMGLEDLVRDAIKTVLAEAEAGEQIETEMRIEPTAKVMVDAAAITTAITSILENAVEAMPSGGRLTVRICTVQYRGRSRALLSIEDSGRGLDSAEAAQAMEPFWSQKPGRAGLGLTLARHIVNIHDGIILIESQKHVGVRVLIYLPFSVSTEHAPEP